MSCRFRRDDKLLIIEAREMQGWKWATIAEMFPNATAKDCCNTYHNFKVRHPEFDIEEEVVAL